MAKKIGQKRIDGLAAPVPSGGRLGPRRLLPVPANDNRLPRHVRLRRGLVLVATAVAIAWALAGLITAAM